MSRPNLLFIMPDQLRHDFLSCYGAAHINTPHIDRIAAEGIRYQQAYSLHPICVPARAALLTGISALRTGVLGNGNGLRPDHLDCGMPTWAQLLSAQDYYTSAIGKMHFYPWDISMGFAHRTVCEDKVWVNIEDDYYHYLAARGHRKYMGKEHQGYDQNRGACISRLPWDCYWDYFVGEEAARFIREYDDSRPFAAMVGFPGPHDPYDPTAEFLAQVDIDAIPDPAPGDPIHRSPDAPLYPPPQAGVPSWTPQATGPYTEAQKRTVRAHYSALILQIDRQVGRILEALEESGQLDNTVIIFSSDHGDMVGDHSVNGKGNFYEGSCHVPMLVRQPGGPVGIVRHDLVALTDVTATLLAAAGQGVPDYMDARPLPGLGYEKEADHQVLYGSLQNGWMAFDGRYKLVKYGNGADGLFDLSKDAAEQHNLAREAAHADHYHRLDALLWRYLMRTTQAAHQDNEVFVPQARAMWADKEFGRKGWQRTYPSKVRG
ncbi:MAG: sulfatase-like hydrolase/transferase [Candidatus Latescibacteria bacterium]|nr:sulfatase-like hydrolase/transferase [Candidatus Latescibacterota bacterium]